MLFFFFDIESDEDVFDDDYDDGGSGSGLPPVRAFLRFLNYPLIIFLDFRVMESPNPFVMSVEYYHFPAQNFSSFKFGILNMITVSCRFTHYFKIMPRHDLV